MTCSSATRVRSSSGSSSSGVVVVNEHWRAASRHVRQLCHAAVGGETHRPEGVAQAAEVVVLAPRVQRQRRVDDPPIHLRGSAGRESTIQQGPVGGQTTRRLDAAQDQSTRDGSHTPTAITMMRHTLSLPLLTIICRAMKPGRPRVSRLLQSLPPPPLPPKGVAPAARWPGASVWVARHATTTLLPPRATAASSSARPAHRCQSSHLSLQGWLSSTSSAPMAGSRAAACTHRGTQTAPSVATHTTMRAAAHAAGGYRGGRITRCARATPAISTAPSPSMMDVPVTP